jgi:hypothetical protein
VLAGEREEEEARQRVLEENDPETTVSLEPLIVNKPGTTLAYRDRGSFVCMRSVLVPLGAWCGP